MKQNVGLGQAGVVVAARPGGPGTATQDPSELARTIAHEIGHYLLDTPDHDRYPWNLMRDANLTPSINNSDLRKDQRDAIQLQPSTVNSDDD